MAVPKRRTSTARKGKRRAVKSLKGLSLAPCSSCQKPKKLHQSCPACGTYKKTDNRK